MLRFRKKHGTTTQIHLNIISKKMIMFDNFSWKRFVEIGADESYSGQNFQEHHLHEYPQSERVARACIFVITPFFTREVIFYLNNLGRNCF